ncbi:MAG TPA: MBL fold metallo-hydrolase [Pseudomonadota bacterium]|nr:MBL fold metallo-hydrolase [Pseudomonadota bacterium]HNN50638.1 MBL fold metallo-hydrolase [Pseudomonadota bacterium]HNO66873.1 MBL fold metallo-hydrolase [Pseudomonadota bacterium]
MQIHFLGAAEEVTGSMYLLELAQGTILIDCGFFQGRREESHRRNARLPKEATQADVAILTHAHIDHSGNLPTLVKSGFQGSIYATPATRDLCAYMLRDSARIQEADAAYLNRKYKDDPDFSPIAPIYDEEDVIKALERFVGMPYHHTFYPLPGVRAEFYNAGHILGSSEAVLTVEENGTRRTILFSGDLGRKGLPIIRDPEYPPPPIDYVVMESTYGNRVHGSILQMEDDLERVIKETVRRGGKVIVPAFAVGRTQELLYALHSLSTQHRIPPIPVFIDSPLAINVTEVFKLHPECFDQETRAFLSAHGEVFDYSQVRFVSSREESLRLNDLKGSAIIISASGMAEAGRILHHLRNNVEDERNTILIVGFMAQHTLGRRLAEQRPRVKIWGVERDLHARVEVMNSFSAHADRRDLLEFARRCGTETRTFFLVHGEPEAQKPLKDEMTQKGHRVRIPSRGEVISLE